MRNIPPSSAHRGRGKLRRPLGSGKNPRARNDWISDLRFSMCLIVCVCLCSEQKEKRKKRKHPGSQCEMLTSCFLTAFRFSLLMIQNERI